MDEIIDIEKIEIPFEPGYYCDKYGNVYHGDKPMTVGMHRGVPGYVRITTMIDGKPKCRLYTVARLMGATWLGANENDVICFRDGDRTNTYIDNLYIGTRSELFSNLYDFKKQNKLNNDRRLTRETYRSAFKVYQVDAESKELVGEFNSLYAAASYLDVPVQAVERCCNDHRYTCCGYKWCYDFEYDTMVNE